MYEVRYSYTVSYSGVSIMRRWTEVRSLERDRAHKGAYEVRERVPQRLHKEKENKRKKEQKEKRSKCADVACRGSVASAPPYIGLGLVPGQRGPTRNRGRG